MMQNLNAEEKQSISELLSRAAFAYDEKDIEMLSASFSVDAQFTMRIADGDLIGPFKGREGIMKLMIDSRLNTTLPQHTTLSPQVTVHPLLFTLYFRILLRTGCDC